MTASPERPPDLRSDPAALAALVHATARYLQINDAFVEKDFWAIEVLRVCALGDEIEVNGTMMPVTAIFKGGTSLSRVHGLIDRFSEDIDVLIVFPSDTGANSRGKALKRIAERVRQHLGLHENDREVLGSTTGVHRDIGYRYPRAFGSDLTKEHILLEMGSRGGTNPHETHSLRSLAADHAIDVLGESADTWAEFQPIEIAVLAPERTLFEKLALLHDRATRYPDSDQARDAMALAGRHFYDVHQLLSNPGVRAALTELGPDGIREIVADIDQRSQAAGWRSTPRPEGSYADSPAFQHNAPSTQTAEASYALALGMVYGERPTFTECLATVQAQRDLL